MNKEEFENQLKKLDFHFEIDEEYHRDVFTSDHFKVVKTSTSPEGNMEYLTKTSIYRLNLEIYVDRYTVSMIWWLDRSHKVTKSYYMHIDVKEKLSAVGLISDFVAYCVDTYKVDLNNYKE